ncbi:hypothetical protein [Enterobacter sp. PTB]|uniref:hypothetical protein n=1 Tax=Enterobacter sp. PTB TaxID=3143437 RepID=UPI003DA991EC
MKLEELIAMFPQNGKILLRICEGEILFYAIVPEDHVTLSLDAFVEYAKRAGWEIKRK